MKLGLGHHVCFLEFLHYIDNVLLYFVFVALKIIIELLRQL